MKARIFSLLFALLAVFAFNDAFAQGKPDKNIGNPHLQGPLYATHTGLFLEVCFDVAGLGNVSETDLVIKYDAFVETECENPAGNVAPGQSQQFKGETEDFKVKVSNGRASDCKTTTQTFSAGKGPNPKWDCKVVKVTYSNISISIGGKTFPVTDIR